MIGNEIFLYIGLISSLPSMYATLIITRSKINELINEGLKIHEIKIRQIQ